jgi:tRNA nucleotidyltransferase (CCA-adding enzyme)
MGGGGGSFDMISPSEYNKMKEELKEKTKDEQFETQVAELIATLLSDYNDRDHQAIKAHLEKINEYLEKVFGGTIDIIFGGSIKKHTYIDGLSDIDVLVLINKCDLSDLSPKGVLRKIQSRLLDRKFKDV